jgi:large subunit ribosomal protein L30
MAIKLKVTQIRSSIGRPKPQVLLLKGLGLRGINKSSELLDTPAIRGMIRNVSHLVTVQAVE